MSSAKRWLSRSSNDSQVVDPTKIINSFSVSFPMLRMITEDMFTSFRKNLTQTNPESSMAPTYITVIPDGSERGSFLAVSLANKLNVSYFELDGAGGTSTCYQKYFELTSAKLGGDAEELFGYIAKCIAEVVDEWNVNGTPERPRYIGMSFPFPVQKTSLGTGKLMRWTKEVSAGVKGDGSSDGGTVGKDIVKLLQESLDKLGLCVQCNAHINDTTATLLAQAYYSEGCDIGAIFDSGTNAAYVEKVANVQSLRGRKGLMVLNTDWGSFISKSEQALHQTQFDYRIDRESAHPGEQVFEKLISASSVGELTRLVLLHFIDSESPSGASQYRPLFNRRSSTRLNTKGGIDIELVWEISAATDFGVRDVLVKKLDLLLPDVNEEDGKQVKAVCRAILRRTAYLSACAIAALLILMDRASLRGEVGQGGHIAIAGSLARLDFKRDMEEALQKLIGEATTRKVLIGQVNLKDASDIGAALGAYLAGEDMRKHQGAFSNKLPNKGGEMAVMQNPDGHG